VQASWQISRQADRQAGKLADKQINWQTSRQADRQTGEQEDEQAS
jgi:hypothetical protein